MCWVLVTEKDKIRNTDKLNVQGMAFNGQLIIKENCRASTIKVFEGTNITKVGYCFRVLGSFSGKQTACDNYI